MSAPNLAALLATKLPGGFDPVRMPIWLWSSDGSKVLWASRSALALAPRSRLYEIAVAQWVLFDEVNFPDRPKQTIPAG